MNTEVRVGFVTASLNEKSRRALRALGKVAGPDDQIAFVDTGTKNQRARQALRAGLRQLRKQYGERLWQYRCDERTRRGSGCNYGIREMLAREVQLVMFMDADDSYGKPYAEVMRHAYHTSKQVGAVYYPTRIKEVQQNEGKTEHLHTVELKLPEWDDPPAVWAEFARYGASFAYAAHAFNSNRCGLLLEKFKADEVVEFVCRCKRLGQQFVAVEVPEKDAYRYYQHQEGTNPHAELRVFYSERRVQVAHRALTGEEMLPEWRLE